MEVVIVPNKIILKCLLVKYINFLHKNKCISTKKNFIFWNKKKTI